MLEWNRNIESNEIDNLTSYAESHFLASIVPALLLPRNQQALLANPLEDVSLQLTLMQGRNNLLESQISELRSELQKTQFSYEQVLVSRWSTTLLPTEGMSENPVIEEMAEDHEELRKCHEELKWCLTAKDKFERNIEGLKKSLAYEMNFS